MRRYDCFQALGPRLTNELVIANLANTTTEWRAVRPHDGNLYFVGMGMVTPYALGLALALPNRRVLALDGDGGLLFDLAVLGNLAQASPPNLCLIVFDNEGYVSTGKFASAASLTAGPFDLEAVARAAGLKEVCTVRDLSAFADAVADGTQREGRAVSRHRQGRTRSGLCRDDADRREGEQVPLRPAR